MPYSPEELKKLRCYSVYFWHNSNPLNVNPQQAAGIKFAVKNNLKFFEIGKNLYMCSDIRRIEFNCKYEIHPNDLADNATLDMLNTNYYHPNPLIV